MKNRIKSVLLIFTILVITFIIYNRRFDIEFKYHIYGFDKKLVHEDFLHPTFAYLKNEKLIGIEFISNPECGQITKWYFLDEDEVLEKVIYKTDFFTEHCDSNSLYIIKNIRNKIHVIEKNEAEINNEALKQLISSFNIQAFKKEIEKWEQ